MPKTKTQKPKRTAPKPKRSKSKSTAKKNGAKKVGAVKNQRWVKIAKLATVLVTSDGNGKTLNRAAITTPKVDMVMTKLVGRKSASAVLKSYGFKSTAQAEKYAGGKLTRGDLTPEINRAVSEAAKKIGDPKIHKINGRALAAVIVAASK